MSESLTARFDRSPVSLDKTPNHDQTDAEASDNQRPTTCLNRESRFRVVLPTKGDQEGLAAVLARSRVQFMNSLRESTAVG